MRKNYFTCVLVSLIMVFLVSGVTAVSETVETDTRLLQSAAQRSGNAAFIKFSEDAVRIQEKIIASVSTEGSGFTGAASNSVAAAKR